MIKYCYSSLAYPIFLDRIHNNILLHAFNNVGILSISLNQNINTYIISNPNKYFIAYLNIDSTDKLHQTICSAIDIISTSYSYLDDTSNLFRVYNINFENTFTGLIQDIILLIHTIFDAKCRNI